MVATDHIKEQYQEFKVLQEHMEKLNEHTDMLERQLVLIDDTKDALHAFSSVLPGQEMLVPLADGIFLKAKFAGNPELLVNVGAGAVVPRSCDQVILMLDEQRNKITLNIGEARRLLEQFEGQAMQIYREVESQSE